MTVYKYPAGPVAFARYLLTYMTDDSAIIAHVRRDYGYDLSTRDLDRIRRDMPKGLNAVRANLQATKEPISWENGQQDAKDGSAKLLAAIIKHHPRIVESLKANNARRYGGAAL